MEVRVERPNELVVVLGETLDQDWLPTHYIHENTGVAIASPTRFQDESIVIGNAIDIEIRHERFERLGILQENDALLPASGRFQDDDIAEEVELTCTAERIAIDRPMGGSVEKRRQKLIAGASKSSPNVP
jgi:hypothetical protein